MLVLVRAVISLLKHGFLLSLKMWKLGPPPKKFEIDLLSHSNEPDNQCPLKCAIHKAHIDTYKPYYG